jgi:competence protein ComFC
VVQINNACCPICGQPGQPGKVCRSCRKDPPPFQALRSFGMFQGPLREAIHILKYQKEIGIGEALSAHLINFVIAQGWSIDMVTAVPLSHKRLHERGYNQAALLARPLAYFLEVPYQSNAVERIRDTVSQVGLNAAERRTNVTGAFQSRPTMVEGKTILVIDDVTTTGATLQACAAALQAAGSTKVYGLTLARAPHPGSDAPDSERSRQAAQPYL